MYFNLLLLELIYYYYKVINVVQFSPEAEF